MSVLTVVAVWALSGCSDVEGSPAASPPPSTGATAAGTPASSADPFSVTEVGAAEALASLELPDQFVVDVTCPPRTEQDRKICSGPSAPDVSWVASRTYLGASIRGAQGLPATVTINLTAADDPAAVARLYEARLAVLRQRDGQYRIPARGATGSRAPGERGQGTLTTASDGAWTGSELSDRYVYELDGSRSADVTARTRIEQRGPYLLDVSWSATKDQRDLDELPHEVVTALER